MAFIIADRVKETTTTTGTGALTLAGTLTGFTTFAARCAVGDTLYYAIQAVDGTGAPTGEWECGLGTYSGTSTLTRSAVTSSSNSDAAVSFAAGTKQVFITLPAVQARWARERLTADRIYYVRPDGSDTNTGLIDSAGGAFLTIQQAVDVVAKLDIGDATVTIRVADGTYSAGVTSFKTPAGSGSVRVEGNLSTPASCVISCTSGTCIFADGYSQVKRYVAGFKVINSSGIGIASRDGALLYFSNIDFGACSGYHMTTSNGAILSAYGDYSVSGSAAVHLFAEYASIVNIFTRNVTFSGVVAFASGFVISRQASMVAAYGMTFSGTNASVTGPRYEVQTNAVCFINGASSTYFPGNSSGATATGGQYA